MGRVIARRLAAGIPILLILSAFVFVLVDLAPGDAAEQLAGENATDVQIEAVREELRLDDPLPVRYGRWLGNAVQGDLGESLRNGADVRTTIIERLPISFSIAAIALTFGIILGVAFGTVAAVQRGRLVDRLVSGAASMLISVPPFVIALVLVMLFAVEWGMLPAIGYVGFAEDPAEWLRHLLLPGFALSAYLSAEVALQLRAALLEALDRDFILATRARGISPSRVVLKHAARMAALPVVTVIGLRIGLLIGGTVIVERVFVINGIGTLAISATIGQDINMLLGIMMVVATIILAANVLVDISYGLLNPKMRKR